MGKLVNEYCEKIYLTDDNPRKENPKKIRKEIKSKINKSKLIEIPSRKKWVVWKVFYLCCQACLRSKSKWIMQI